MHLGMHLAAQYNLLKGLQPGVLIYVCVFSFVWVQWNGYYSEINYHIPHLTKLLFLFVVEYKISCLRKFQVFIVALLTILTMLNEHCGLINLITRSLYWWEEIFTYWGMRKSFWLMHNSPLNFELTKTACLWLICLNH